MILFVRKTIINFDASPFAFDKIKLIHTIIVVTSMTLCNIGDNAFGISIKSSNKYHIQFCLKTWTHSLHWFSIVNLSLRAMSRNILPYVVQVIHDVCTKFSLRLALIANTCFLTPHRWHVYHPFKIYEWCEKGYFVYWVEIKIQLVLLMSNE